MLDFLQNKDGKALVLTNRSAIYLDLVRQSARWAVPLAALIGVSSSGVLDSYTSNTQPTQPGSRECAVSWALLIRWPMPCSLAFASGGMPLPPPALLAKTNLSYFCMPNVSLSQGGTSSAAAGLGVMMALPTYRPGRAAALRAGCGHSPAGRCSTMDHAAHAGGYNLALCACISAHKPSS